MDDEARPAESFDDEPRELIRSLLQQHGEVTTSDVVEATGLTRQTAHYHIRKLVKAGELIKQGKTRGTRYVSPDMAKERPGRVKRRYDFSDKPRQKWPGEDRVFRDISLEARLGDHVNKNARGIVEYAFTKMMNNALEHSDGERFEVSLRATDTQCSFTVRDWGIGAFERIRRYQDAASVSLVPGDLIKGKLTTAPERHSGEGIFFTSRAADRFELESNGIRLVRDSDEGGWFTENSSLRSGTRVHVAVRSQTKSSLRDVFDEYAGEEYDFAFEETAAVVHLQHHPEEQGPSFVSRSEARRLLHRLDEFTTITFDFEQVPRIGQAFADEIFRVFAHRHPDTVLRFENASPAIESMIHHVTSTQKEQQDRS